MKLRAHSLWIPLVLLGATGCANMPTLESIKYGYNPDRVESVRETPDVSDKNDVASGWAPDPAVAAEASSAPVLYGRDGTPVGASQPGSVTTTNRPINDGVAAEVPQGGSRSLLLDLYGDAVDERDELQRANEDLQAALDMSEQRAAALDVRLGSLQTQFDELGRQKQRSDTQSTDLAARLATAQIARLEAERALLEATIEWRKMSQENNRPLTSERSAR